MTKVLIVYAADYGNTQKIAEVIASGVTSVPGTDVEIKLAEDVTEDDVIASDAVIVSSPVHMGSPDWRVKNLSIGFVVLFGLKIASLGRWVLSLQRVGVTAMQGVALS